jgi:hypothetical protein
VRDAIQQRTTPLTRPRFEEVVPQASCKLHSDRSTPCTSLLPCSLLSPQHP